MLQIQNSFYRLGVKSSQSSFVGLPDQYLVGS